LRRSPLLRPAILYALALYFVMTFVFSYPGARGGLFHSGAALLPFYFAAAPIGLERAVRWIASRRRGWRVREATQVFLAGLCLIALALTGAIFYQRVVGPDAANPSWNRQDEVYAAIGGSLAGVWDTRSVVLANNPPAFYYFTDHPSVVVPNGGVSALLAVADRFDVRWAVLDTNLPDGLRSLYEGRETSDRLVIVEQFEDAEGRPVILYEVRPAG